MTVDRPEWAQTVMRLSGGSLVRCQTCGQEAETLEVFTHHENCPEDDNE